MQIARSWRQQASNLRLVGSRCKKCGAVAFPERIRCVGCGGREMEDHQFSGRGEVFCFTQVFEAPRGFEHQVPYLTALVELEEGPTVPAMLTDIDVEDVRVGMPVEMVTRRIRAHGESGPIEYAYKFAPTMED